MQQLLGGAERALASVGGLALYALNEVRMVRSLPHAADISSGQTHALTLQFMGAPERLYASVLDLMIRWGLAGLTFGLCMWALAETLRPARAQNE